MHHAGGLANRSPCASRQYHLDVEFARPLSNLVADHLAYHGERAPQVDGVERDSTAVHAWQIEDVVGTSVEHLDHAPRLAARAAASNRPRISRRGPYESCAVLQALPRASRI